MFLTLETLYLNNFLVTITNIVLMSDNTGNISITKGFQNPHLAFSAPTFVSELELELLGSVFFLSELELELQCFGGQIGAGSKS